MKTFTAQVRDFAKLTKQNMIYVASESIQDVLEGAQTPQRGISAGATSFVEGKIPVAKGDLINSLSVDGGAAGKDSYSVVIAGYDLGDNMRFVWTAAHAMRMEMGFTGTDSKGRTFNQQGRHFVGKNAAKFQEFVDKHVKEVRR